MSAPTSLLQRFARDERGVFAVIFGVMAVVLIALGGAVVDYVRLEQTRQRAQTALDAAVLALQPDVGMKRITREQVEERAQALIVEQIGDPQVTAMIDDVRINDDDGTLFLGGRFTMPTIFVQLVGVPRLSASFSTEAMQGSVDVEVSIALDVTGSMAGQRIRDLKSSVSDLIQTVVQDAQEPSYSKVALVPYSQAVNPGQYAEALRGPIRGPKGIQSISWSTGPTRTITGANKENPLRITSPGHGFNNNDWVYIWNVNGMTQINTRAFQVQDRTNDTFRLRGEDGYWHSNYSSGGSVIKCLMPNCDVVVTSNNHGYANNDYVQVTDVRGMTGLNNKTFRVSNVTTNTLVLPGLSVGGGGSYVANSGQLHCTWQNATEGCTYYRFTNANNQARTLAVTNCVTERANFINDAPPSTAFVGRNYPPSGACPNTTIVPLTSDKAVLQAAVNSLPANGTTAGALGILWSWYMLSPSFGYVWPEESRPAPYGRDRLLKAAVIMTDGEFNTAHCNGVVSRESTIVGANDRINCYAHNGDSDRQARRYCDQMKAADPTMKIYTVGFGMRAGTAAANIMAYCASSPENAYLAENGSELHEAFQRIAGDISALRITR